MVIWPPIANPKVTAGFTWPPEILAAIDTATKSANAWQTATATRPGGSKAASAVNFPVSIKSSNYALRKLNIST